MAEIQARIAGILNKANNKVCADCDAKNPRWVSLSLGVLVCIRCCGMHRNLGTHISKMKSTTLDKWLPDWCSLFECLDNSIANEHWEKNRPAHVKRPTESSSSTEVERFIRDKYELKRWAAGAEDPVKAVLNGGLKNPAPAPQVPAVQTAPSKQTAQAAKAPQSLDLLSMGEEPFDPFPQKQKEEEMVWHAPPEPTQPAVVLQPPVQTQAVPPVFTPQFPSAVPPQPTVPQSTFQSTFQPTFQPTVQPTLQPTFQTPAPAEKEASIRAILSMYQQPQPQVKPTQAFIPLGAIAAEQMMRGAPGMYAWQGY